jgi:hypothetical protein
MARVNLDSQVFTDIRFKIAAKKLGIDHFSLIGRMAYLWSYCTENSQYELSEEYIDTVLELSNCVEILAEQNLIKRGKKKNFYINGTKGRIEWLNKLKSNSKQGGKATSEKYKEIRRAKRLAKQQPKGQPDDSQNHSPLSLTLSHSLSNNNTRDLLDYSSFLDAYKSNRGVLPDVLKLSDARKRKIKTRVKSFPNVDDWAKATKNLAKTEFCHQWANFDWLIKSDENFEKALIDNYNRVIDKPSEALQLLTYEDITE